MIPAAEAEEGVKTLLAPLALSDRRVRVSVGAGVLLQPASVSRSLGRYCD